ncbi:M67 family metallopeptidase [Paenibacillus sp. GCM10028914]|uniref:M67 family metallopeptidase n=1 Tax=Paenibacillus sp. GCM10028914 TaxID=3273416 RepID=UPI0036200BDD
MDINNSVEVPFRITSEVMDLVTEHTFTCLPEEACGIILGNTTEGTLQLDGYIPVPNRAADPLHHFSLDPEIWTSLLFTEPRICGLFHSHPTSPPAPSKEDLLQLQSFGGLLQVYFIGSPLRFDSKELSLRAYRIMRKPMIATASKPHEALKPWILKAVDYTLS